MSQVIPVHLAVEDELSEAVLRKIMARCRPGFAIGSTYRRGGFGYLQRTITGFNRAARGTPFVVLTDLDRGECAPALIREWLPGAQHPNLLFRVAVREVEAWLLAHQSALARFLGISEQLVPREVDTLGDPKQELIDLACRSRSRELREAIVPARGSTASIGPDYNGVLSRFVRTRWEPREAARCSPSLERTVRRLETFTPTWASRPRPPRSR